MHKKAISFLLSAAIMLGLLCGTAPEVRAESGMTTSDACIDMIKDMEGFSKYPYYDNGQYTVGYGTACPSEDYDRYKADGITEAEADKLLRNYLASFESSLNSFISTYSLSLEQYQFDALLSFTYNVGSNWMRKESLFRTAVIEGATGNDFIFAIARWCTASGRVLPMLIERRLIEANMYLNGVYSKTVPSNYRYVIYDDNLVGAVNDVRVQAYDASVGDSIRAEPAASGYTFKGWYTKATGGTGVKKLTADLTVTTLYAHWEADDGNTSNTETVVAEGVVNYKKLNVRSGPGTGYSIVGYLYQGDEVEIYETTVVGSTTWGRISDGWISLDYVTLDSDSDQNDTVIMTGKVKATSLNVRGGAGTSYPVVETLVQGTEVEIYETAVVGGTTWGRISSGWISLDYVTMYEEVIAKGVIVNTTRLNVRSGAGTGNALVGYYYAGDVVEIYETTVVGSTTWGRTALGWISLDYVELTVDAPVLSVSNVAATGKVRLTWTAVDGASQYMVYRSASKTGNYKLLKTTASTALTNSSAVAGEIYYYYVVAVTAAGTKSEPSNTVKRACDVAQPVISLSNVASTGKIKISWNAVEGAEGYKVYRATSKNGTYQLLKTVTGTSLTNTSAEAGKTYYYKVVALGPVSSANSADSAVKYRTCDVARPVISLSNVASTGKIKISWNAVEGAVGYEVYRATSKNGTYKLLKTVTGTSLTNTSAEAGKTYYYKVVALGAASAANSADSAVKYRTCDLPRPELSIKLNSNGKPRLSWNAVPGAVKYEVYRASSKNGTYKLLKTVTGTSLTNTSAESGTTYYYKVVAVASSSAADSASSSVVSITSQ